jgi:hypothetical protein
MRRQYIPPKRRLHLKGLRGVLVSHDCLRAGKRRGRSSSLDRVKSGSGAPQSPIQWAPGGSLPKGKAAGE